MQQTFRTPLPHTITIGLLQLLQIKNKKYGIYKSSTLALI